MTNPTAAQPLDLDKLIALIADDGYAISFQSMGQYRSALISQARAARLNTTASAIANYDCYNCGGKESAHHEGCPALAPVAAQQAAAVYPVPIDWRKVVADLTAMNQATAKRAAEIITYVCEEGLKLAAKAPAAQAGADYNDPTLACSSCGLTMGESRTLGHIKLGILAASPASTPEASQQSGATDTCQVCGVKRYDPCGKVACTAYYPTEYKQAAAVAAPSGRRKILMPQGMIDVTPDTTPSVGAATTSQDAQPELMRGAVASVASNADGKIRINWMRPERVEAGTLLYVPAIRATQQEGGK